jgi:hypothetical protein
MTADVTGGKPIAIEIHSILVVNAFNPLGAFTTSMEERELLFFCDFPDTTPDRNHITNFTKIRYYCR